MSHPLSKQPQTDMTDENQLSQSDSPTAHHQLPVDQGTNSVIKQILQEVDGPVQLKNNKLSKHTVLAVTLASVQSNSEPLTLQVIDVPLNHLSVGRPSQ
jgi:hypothetical protein